MRQIYKLKEKKIELIITVILVVGIVGVALFMFLYNRYIIYVQNLESAQINLANHLSYTYKDKFYGDMDVDYDIESNSYLATVDFYIPNEQYDFHLSSKGHVMGDGYLHNNKDDLLSHRYARQLRESLESDFKDTVPEVFKVYTEMQILKGSYDEKSFYSKDLNEPHVVHIYMTSNGRMSKKKFSQKVDEITEILIKKGYKNLNNVHVNYVVRKESPPLYYSPINIEEYKLRTKKN